MGIQRSDRHKRTKTGAKKGIHNKKRKYALHRQPSHTKIGETRVRPLRVRGGNIKKRALRLNQGEFTLRSHQLTDTYKIDVVMYHPTNTELMRTNTLTKSSVVKISNEAAISKIKSVCDNKSADKAFHENLEKSVLYGIIDSRPGQDGYSNGHILQGEELEFYMARFKKSKKH
ncbi:ribosomal protein S8A [Binucleata daphniae]